MAGAQDSIKIESLRTRVVRAKSKLREREAEVERLQRYRSYWDAANFKGMSEDAEFTHLGEKLQIAWRDVETAKEVLRTAEEELEKARYEDAAKNYREGEKTRETRP